MKVSDISPNLPIKPGMAGERPDTLADITKMKDLLMQLPEIKNDPLIKQ